MLDIIGLCILLAFFLQGYRKGIIIALFSVLAFVIGMVCALKLSHKLAGYLFAEGWVTGSWAQIVSYILLFAGVAWLVRLGGRALSKSLDTVMLGFPNKMVGGLLYASVGAFIWSSFLWLANQTHAIAPETIAGSKTYASFIAFAPWVLEKMGKALPFAGTILQELHQFFEGVNQHLPNHVGAH